MPGQNEEGTHPTSYMCVCVRARARARACVRVCVRVCACVCVWTQMHTNTFVPVRAYLHMRANTCNRARKNHACVSHMPAHMH